jgi:hypothetical protein
VGTKQRYCFVGEPGYDRVHQLLVLVLHTALRKGAGR